MLNEASTFSGRMGLCITFQVIEAVPMDDVKLRFHQSRKPVSACPFAAKGFLFRANDADEIGLSGK